MNRNTLTSIKKQIEFELSLLDSATDYKDLAVAIENAILIVIDQSSPILKDMPSAFDCPRAFMDWWTKINKED